MDLVITGFSQLSSAPSAQSAGGAEPDSAAPETFLDQLFACSAGLTPDLGEGDGALIAAPENDEDAARESLLASGNQEPAGRESGKRLDGDDARPVDDTDASDRVRDDLPPHAVVAVSWQTMPVIPAVHTPETKPVPAIGTAERPSPQPENAPAVSLVIADVPGGADSKSEHKEQANQASVAVNELERGEPEATSRATNDAPDHRTQRSVPRAARALAKALAELDQSIPVTGERSNPCVTDAQPALSPEGGEPAGQVAAVSKPTACSGTERPSNAPLADATYGALRGSARAPDQPGTDAANDNPSSDSRDHQRSTFERVLTASTHATSEPRETGPTAAVVHAAPPSEATPLAPLSALPRAPIEKSDTPADEREMVPQLVRAMRTQFRAGVSEARIRLNPEHLGEVRVSIRIEGDRVSALLHVERPDVQRAIESQSDSLRSALAAQGFTLEHLAVRSEEPPRQPSSSEPEHRGRDRDQPPSQRRPRKREHDKEFELSDT